MAGTPGVNGHQRFQALRFKGGGRQAMAKWLILAGAILIVVGAVAQFAPWLLNWFGKLPGDIRIETASGNLFIPVTSMLIVSIVLTVLVNLFNRW
jgi:hypothetical protein